MYTQGCPHTSCDRLQGARLDERPWNVIWVSNTPQLAQDWPLPACAGLCHWSLGALNPPSGWRTGAHEPTAGLTQGGLGPQPCSSGYGEVCPGSWSLDWILS